MQLTTADFRIPAEKTHKAWLAIHELMYDDTAEMSGYDQKRGSRFAWMNGVEPTNWDSLEDAMAGWRFPIERDTNGNVVGISFTGEKAGDEQELFAAIAPFVETGSFIEFEGADQYMWQYTFDETSMETIHITT